MQAETCLQAEGPFVILTGMDLWQNQEVKWAFFLEIKACKEDGVIVKRPSPLRYSHLSEMSGRLCEVLWRN